MPISASLSMFKAFGNFHTTHARFSAPFRQPALGHLALQDFKVSKNCNPIDEHFAPGCNPKGQPFESEPHPLDEHLTIFEPTT